MILQALTAYYETLSARGEAPAYGWGYAKVSFALCINQNGALEQVVSVKTEQQRGKKLELVPQNMLLPAQVKRANGIAANFLCDNASYFLGVDNKGKPERALQCFAACKELHETILKDVDTPAAHAVLAFFRCWKPEEAADHPALAECLEDALAGANFVFRCAGDGPQDDPQIRKAWETHYSAVDGAPEMACLVTGAVGPVESIHPVIKNVHGAQSMGAALVSFNAPAYCSYGKEQNLNAPTSKYAAFAYTTALNHLLDDREHVWRLGNTTVVCWAQNGGNAYQNLMGWIGFGGTAPYSFDDLQSVVARLCQGEAVQFEEELLDPQMEFYILGLSPNAARLSVRFFLRNTFGAFLTNTQAHQQRLEIVRPAYDNFETIPLWKLLEETVNQNARDKTPSPELAGEVARAVLNNTPYPVTLLNSVMLRIRAEHKVTRGRAAILKAYYLKNSHTAVPKEVLTVALNTQSTNIPYNLGRVFSVLEAIQSAANPGINTTIRDRYFNAASATPAHVFPVLVNLAQKHLKKMDGGKQAYYIKQLVELMDKLGENYPARLNLPQQGAFQLGYYQQTQARFEKKEEK
nr:type I-C CRISPR-associated protein Cas8c/Csd1 [uncultured Agathobaculum sp.]